MEHQMQEFMQRLQMLQQQQDLLQHQLLELEKVKETVSSISSAENDEILVPLGAGVFAKGQISDSKKVFMNVGSGIVVEKQTSDAEKKVDEQMEQLKTINNQMQEELVHLKTMVQTMQMGHTS